MLNRKRWTFVFGSWRGTGPTSPPVGKVRIT